MEEASAASVDSPEDRDAPIAGGGLESSESPGNPDVAAPAQLGPSDWEPPAFVLDLENDGRYPEGSPLPADAPGGVAVAPQPSSVRALLDRWSLAGPEVVVLLAVGWGLVVSRAQRLPVAYPNDSSVHSLTVAWATYQLNLGHFPLDGWFPYLSLGSPFFLHYQSISAVITGLLGLIIGSSSAFGWTLYLLLATWPLSIYFGSRLLNLSRWTAAAAAAAAPLIFSVTGYGFEHQAYDWYGSGLWSQLWGMWLLPIAIGYTWRAVSQRRNLFGAVISFGLLIAFHFLTAYLAGLLILVWVVLRPSEFWRRLGRAALVGLGGALIACWVLVPLYATDKWSATNQFEIGQFWDNGYGARQVLSDLVHGRMFDSGLGAHTLGRFPVFSLLAALGLLACLITFRRDERSRVLVSIGVLSVLLTSGRTTFHAAVDVLPFNSQLLLHRYVMGIDTAGIFLVGVGAESLFRLLAGSVGAMRVRVFSRVAKRPGALATGTVAAICGLVAILYPAWHEIGGYEALNATEIGFQRQIDATAGAQVNELIHTAESLGGGRIYAGLPSNWGHSFLVGSVPVYIYLADEGVDAVGFTLRTSSLMTDPEAYFDESNIGDYEAFGIHYLLLPTGHTPPVPARLVQQEGGYLLYSVATTGLIHVVDTVQPIAANGTDLGTETASFLSSSLIDENRFPTVAFDGQPAADPTSSASAPLGSTPAGQVSNETDDLVEGEASATVTASRTAVVLLSASFDGGWTVTVDGQPATTEMVAPALVGVTVSPGTHFVTFRYESYPYYPELFLIAALTTIGFWFFPRRWRRGLAVEDDPGSPSSELAEPDGEGRDSVAEPGAPRSELEAPDPLEID